jgi:integrase
MASIEKRIGKDGRSVAWRVKWRVGGTREGAQDGETCDDLKAARRFKALVEAAGERRPTGYPKGCRGRQTAALDAEPDLGPAGTEQSAGPSVSARAAGRTFSLIVEEYLGQLKKPARRQVADYRRRWQQNVASAVVTLPDGRRVGPLGALPIEQVTGEVLQAWVTWMEQRRWVYGPKDPIPKPYSPKTIANIHGGIIRPALGFAATKRGYLDANPAAGVELPRRDGRTVTPDCVPAGTELEQWITIGYSVGVLAGDIITVALGTGLRWGEITALRPCDLDMDARLLTVNQVVKEDENRRPYIAPYGKSPAAQRTIRLPARVIAMLRRRIQGLELRALIFTTTRGGILTHSGGWYDTHWSKVVQRAQKAGILTAVTPHKFRHAHATALLAKNVSLDTVSKRLGHSSVVTTADLYGHRTPEADRHAVEVMDQVMGHEIGEVPA